MSGVGRSVAKPLVMLFSAFLLNAAIGTGLVVTRGLSPLDNPLVVKSFSSGAVLFAAALAATTILRPGLRLLAAWDLGWGALLHLVSMAFGGLLFLGLALA
jgi:hypothetical protein